MKYFVATAVIVIIVVGIGLLLKRGNNQLAQPPTAQPPITAVVDNSDVSNQNISNSNTMKLNSLSFTENESISAKFTCDGENVNPQLTVSGVPDTAKSLVLVMDDPDAPSGTWTHWTVWNIDPQTREIGENSVPAGAVQGTTSDGTQGYHGPCPPSGAHRYFFKVYTLNTVLTLAPSARVDELSAALNGHVIDQAELMGKYGR